MAGAVGAPKREVVAAAGVLAPNSEGVEAGAAAAPNSDGVEAGAAPKAPAAGLEAAGVPKEKEGVEVGPKRLVPVPAAAGVAPKEAALGILEPKAGVLAGWPNPKAGACVRQAARGVAWAA